MRIYIGFDDTDNTEAEYGTGKLARWFEEALPDGCRLWGVVRQQLLVHEEVPYTSHNSSACLVIDTSNGAPQDQLIDAAVRHLERYAQEGSDPGLCVAVENNPSLPGLTLFGRACTHRVVTQKEALRAAGRAHLSGHGGTCDGIIGAAAAVGLTASGWSGRFIEFGRLRDFPDILKVKELERAGIEVLGLDQGATVPSPEDHVHTKGWLRPRLWGGKPALCALPKEKGHWEAVGRSKRPRKSE